MSNRVMSLGIGVLLLFSVIGGISSVGVATTPDTTGESAVQHDGVLIEANISENGNATWSLTYRYELDTENKTARFNTLQSHIDNHPRKYRTEFKRNMKDTVDRSEAETNRNMRIRNASVSTTTEHVPAKYGEVTYTYTWTNFANTTGESLQFGDSLSSVYVEDNTTISIQWPDEYNASVSPTPDSRKVGQAIWHGPVDFDDEESDVSATKESRSLVSELNPAGILVGATVTAAFGVVSLLAGLHLPSTRLIELSLTSIFPMRQAHSVDSTPDEASDSEKSEEKEATGQTGTSDESDKQNAGESSNQNLELRTDSSVENLDSESQTTVASREELSPLGEDNKFISDEERVRKLLDEHNRVKQKDIQNTFEWSKSKTSRVVSRMEKHDFAGSYRVGREKVVTHPEYEPDTTIE